MPEPREAARPGGDDSQPASFEQAFTRLEETVRALESGKLTLEEAMRLFELGIVLAKRCNELLSLAELKVTRLQSAFAEQMRVLQEEAPASGDGDGVERVQ